MALALSEHIAKFEGLLSAGKWEKLAEQWRFLREKLAAVESRSADLELTVADLEEQLARLSASESSGADSLYGAFEKVKGKFTSARIEQIIQSAVATQPAQALRVLAQMAEGEIGGQPAKTLEGIQVVIIEPFASEYQEAQNDGCIESGQAESGVSIARLGA